MKKRDHAEHTLLSCAVSSLGIDEEEAYVHVYLHNSYTDRLLLDQKICIASFGQQNKLCQAVESKNRL